MIVVKVELHSAITGEITEIAMMEIANIGGSNTIGNYDCCTLRGRSAQAFTQRQVQRKAKVLGHPRLSQHVWNLVAKSLKAMGYGARS